MSNRTNRSAEEHARLVEEASAPCACGCGQKTPRRVRMLPRAQVATARALRWAEQSIRGLRELVPVAPGHADDVPDYLTLAEEREARGDA